MDSSLKRLKSELERTEAVLKELSINFRLIVSLRIEIAANPLIIPYAEAMGFDPTDEGFAFQIENLDSFTLFYARIHDLYLKIADLEQSGIELPKQS